MEDGGEGGEAVHDDDDRSSSESGIVHYAKI